MKFLWGMRLCGLQPVAFCTLCAWAVTVYVLFMESCRVPLLSNENDFGHLNSTLEAVSTHWLQGTAQESLEQSSGQVLVAGCRLLEALNVSYVLVGGALVSTLRHAREEELAQMIPWDKDADVLVLAEAEQVLRSARDSGLLARHLDEERFDFQFGTKWDAPSLDLMFVGIVRDRKTKRRLEFARAWLSGKAVEGADACTLSGVSLRHAFGSCSSIDVRDDPWPQSLAEQSALCQSRCQQTNGCEYWHVRPEDYARCLSCDRLAWQNRESFRATPGMLAGPARCSVDVAAGVPDGNNTFLGPAIRTPFSSAYSPCRGCHLRPEPDSSGKVKKTLFVPPDWLFPSRPCPTAFWHPGSEAVVLQCPAQSERYLEYYYGPDWTKAPPKKALCGTKKTQLDAWLVALAAVAPLAACTAYGHLRRRLCRLSEQTRVQRMPTVIARAVVPSRASSSSHRYQVIGAQALEESIDAL